VIVTLEKRGDARYCEMRQKKVCVCVIQEWLLRVQPQVGHAFSSVLAAPLSSTILHPPLPCFFVINPCPSSFIAKMTVKFKNLRAFGYGEHAGPLRRTRSEDVAGAETLFVHQSQCSSWPVAYSGSQVISPPNSCHIRAVSSLLPLSSSLRVKWIDRSLQFHMVSTPWLHPQSPSLHSSYYCKSFRRARISLTSPSPLRPSLNTRIVRLFGSRPWIDALSLLVMAISWLGKARCMRAT
jgi:hypothetical protein